MEVFKRDGSPFYYYSFSVNGKRYKKSTKRTKEVDAMRVCMAEYNAVLNNAQFGEKPDISVADAFDRKLKAIKDGPHSTYRQYRLVKEKLCGLGKFNRPDHWSINGDLPLTAITTDLIEDLAENRRDEDLANNSINIEIRVIQSVWNFNRRRFKTHPDTEFPKVKSFVKTRYFSDGEEAEIIRLLTLPGAKATDAKALSLFLFLTDTGVRLSEALSLQWSNFRLDDAVFEVFRAKTTTLNECPLSDRLVEDLRRRHNEAAPFVSMDYALKVLRGVINDVCNGNAQQNKTRGRATLHTCRDTFTTRMERRGLSLRQIGKLIGHSSIETTKKYAHLESTALLNQARAALNAG